MDRHAGDHERLDRSRVRDRLAPILHGTLAFVGFTVVEPFVVYAPGRLDPAERAAELVRYARRVVGLETAPVLPPTRSDDFDRSLIRKPLSSE